MADLYFEVLDGKTLALAKAHVADRMAVMERNRAFLATLGVERWWPSLIDGTAAGVDFGDGLVHPDFRKPGRKGHTSPRKGTEWAKRFEAQVGYDALGHDVARELGIPTSISYKGEKATVRA